MPYILDIHDKLRKRGLKQFGIHLCGNQMHNLECYNELKLEKGSIISSDEKKSTKKSITGIGAELYICRERFDRTFDFCNAGRSVLEV